MVLPVWRMNSLFLKWIGERKCYGRNSLVLLPTFLLLVFTQPVMAQLKARQPKPPKNLTSRVWLTAHLLPGSGQIRNKQYWKLPLFYGGMGSMLYLSIDANRSYLGQLSRYNSLDDSDPWREVYHARMVRDRNNRNMLVAATGLFYLASVADAVVVYNKGKHSPEAATILSTLVPGMGQIYNRKYWKVPLIYGGLATFYYMASWNNRGYKRFKTALLLLSDGDPNTVDEFNGTRSEENLRYYMDSYRRNRDMSILGFTVVYILNILDANVDGYLYDWNVDDNLAFRVSPALLNPKTGFAGQAPPVFGLSCRVVF